MSSQTKILVLHRRIFIYALLAILGLLTIVAVIYFSTRQITQTQINTAATFYDPDSNSNLLETSAKYIPGIYTSTIKLGDSQFEVQICLDKNHINAINFTPTDEAISTMYPLLHTTMDELSAKIIENQGVENISYSTEYRYTSLTVLTAVQNTLEKAQK